MKGPSPLAEAVKRRSNPGRKVARITKKERGIIEAVVSDSEQELTRKQVECLAITLRRDPKTIKALVAEARLKFAEQANRYVEIHHQAVEDALKHGTAEALEVAVKGSQWAIEHMSVEGESILEKAQHNDSGAKIMIGVVIGGKNVQAETKQ